MPEQSRFHAKTGAVFALLPFDELETAKAGKIVRRKRLFAICLAGAGANIFARPVVAWWGGRPDSFEFNMFAALALAFAAWNLLTAADKAAAPGDWIACGTLSLACLMPSSLFCRLSIAAFCLFLILRGTDDWKLKAAAIVVGTASLRQPVVAEILRLFGEPLLIFDAAVTEILVRFMGFPIGRTGNILIAEDGHRVAVMSGCASYANLSLALLLWFSLTSIRGKPTGHAAVLPPLGLAAAVLGLNWLRLGAMASGPAGFSSVHGAAGAVFFEVTLIAAIFAASQWSHALVKAGSPGNAGLARAV